MNINFYETIKTEKVHNPKYDIHKIILPLRGLINCSSGSGKTNLLLNLIYEMDKTFHKIIIVTKAPEPLYDMLVDRLKNIEIYYEGSYPTIEKMNKGENGLIIYDDQVTTKDSRISEMYIRGRKLGFSSIYISQSYFGTPKLIRQNINYLWLGKGINKRDLRLILSEYSLNMSVDELEYYYFEITKEHMQFMMLDLHKRNLRRNIKQIIYEF
jgi:hypothetical protein